MSDLVKKIDLLKLYFVEAMYYGCLSWMTELSAIDTLNVKRDGVTIDYFEKKEYCINRVSSEESDHSISVMLVVSKTDPISDEKWEKVFTFLTNWKTGESKFSSLVEGLGRISVESPCQLDFHACVGRKLKMSFE